MTSIRSARGLSLFSTLLVLSLVRFAAPQASQEDANDGFLLFTTDRDNPSNLGMCGNCEDIYVMSPDGTDPTRLTHGGGVPTDANAYNSGGADWSHSKKLIAFQSNRAIPESSLPRGPQLFLMNADGTEQQPLILPQGIAGGAAFPSFSQTGNELCFHSQTMPRRDIYVVNVHGTGLTNLTSPGQIPGQLGQAGDNTRCDWSPKGNGIAFVSTRDTAAGAAANEEIYVMNADGSDVVRLTDVLGSDANPAWSPKGDRIAFESNRDGRPEIYVMDADGSNQLRLTNFDTANPSNVSVTKPTWSPKGDRIAFHRRVGLQGQRGHLEVYTMNADGTDVRQITFTTPTSGFSGFPSWGKWSAQRP
jgi:TolB protein